MADDSLKRVRHQYGRLVLTRLAESVEHIRTCPRCERLFLVAYEASADQLHEYSPALVIPVDVWLIIKLQLPDFRQCPDWPKGA